MLFKNRIIIIIFLFIVLFEVANVKAGLISSTNIYSGFGLGHGGDETMYFGIGYLDLNNIYANDYLLFEDTLLDNMSAGLTLTATQETDPAFSLVTSLMTNGNDDMFTKCVGRLPLFTYSNLAWVCNLSNESVSALGNISGNHGFDLMGYSIESMSLTINSISIKVPGWDPNGDGQFTDYAINSTLDVYGSPAVVPEPISSTLFLIGGGVLAFNCLRKSRVKNNH